MPIAGAPLDRPFNLAEILKQGLDSKPDTDALVSRRRRWTWRTLEAVSTRLAGNYLDLGLVPGDRIASLMPNRTELMIHYLACMKCGLVAVPLNYRYMAPEIDHALDVSGAKILLAHDERRRDLAASRLAGRLTLGQISYDDNGGNDEPSFRSLTEGEPTRDIVLPRPEDPAIIFDYLLHLGQHW
jgi:long-chain acyl-CoA synthetase